MASPTPPQDPTPTTTTTTTPLKFYGTPPLIHYSALGAAVLTPLAAALPGRGGFGSRVQNYALYAGCFWSLNQLAFDYTGTSMVARTNERVDRVLAWAGRKMEVESLPTERARSVKAALERERLRRVGAEGGKVGAGGGDKAGGEAEAKERRGFWKRLWMGGEREGWQERRLAEERKALESGKGYGDLIWEAFEEAWGTKKKGGDEEGEGEGKGEGKK